MFRLYQHHDLDALATLLAALLEREPRRSPLVPDTVLVPNRGTARWLQAQLARSEGCAANLELPLPGRFAWQVLDRTLPGSPDSTAFERSALVWHLYAVLPTVDVPAVQRYLAGEPRERQRYQLAARLAQVFDQYLIHRRDVLAAWEAGRAAGEPPADWQAPVWRALVARTHRRHRAALMTEFLESATAGTLDVSALPRTVYAFGLAELPPDYLRLLHALGRQIDVHFLLPNPSATYWGDAPARRVRATDDPARSNETGVQTGIRGQADPGFRPAAPSGLDATEDEPAHPLLASLGRAGRDFLRVLYDDELAEREEPDLGPGLGYEPPGDVTLLQRVQSSIITGEAWPDARGIEAGDRSIQVHACHGPLREIQVLHDRLLDLLGRDDSLAPRNILVLMPDLARYAPAVHSVFGCATGPARIPYSITDRPRRDTHPIAQTFQRLIELPLWRWTASEVLALAGVPAVMRRFSLDAADLELLQHWVASAGVRWGLDAAGRAAMGSAGFEQNTWRFGLDRLLLGLAQRDDEALVDGVAPWSGLEGGSAGAVGRLWLLLDRLRHWRDRLAERTNPGGWQERLNAMTTDLFVVDSDDAGEQAALETVFDATATLERAADALGDESLSWEATREALLGALAGPSERQPLVTGGVTFASLEPLRGVPFDVICVVGMDDGAFPRQDGQREFNLIQKQSRPGDPSVRDTDRMAFLQALAAARRCFYVSYNAHNVTDGAALEPSSVVAELLDYLHGYHFAAWSREAFEQAVVTTQAMQPFSARYFQGDDARLFTFAGPWRAAAAAQGGAREIPASFIDDTRLAERDSDEPVALADLQRFFRHPAQWFFRERLRLELGEPEDALADEEPRGLDGLERHQLCERLFTTARVHRLETVEPEPSALERAQGRLPPPPLGGAEYAEAAEAVNAVLPLYWQWQDESESVEDLDIDLVLDDGTRILGRVPAVGATELRRLRPGALRLRHLLPWWLEYLAVAASGREIGLRVAGVGGGEAAERTGAVTPDEARALLTSALGHYREGHARALLFEPYIAEHYLGECAKSSRETGAPKSPDEALNGTNGWLSNTYQPPHPARDSWLRPLFGPPPEPLGGKAAESIFVRVTEDVARPLYEHLRQIEAEDAA